MLTYDIGLKNIIQDIKIHTSNQLLFAYENLARFAKTSYSRILILTAYQFISRKLVVAIQFLVLKFTVSIFKLFFFSVMCHKLQNLCLISIFTVFAIYTLRSVCYNVNRRTVLYRKKYLIYILWLCKMK